MDLWTTLLDVLMLLVAALVLGSIFERLRQSAILGYLLAGTVLGPNALGIVSAGEHVDALAELGVALLLFTIGLEFSFSRLRRLGAVALGGGTLQIVLTMIAFAGLGFLVVDGLAAAVTIGAMAALSSTACVLRVLVDRTQIESIHGRNALGILLMQDLAVVPLVLLISLLGAPEGDSSALATAAIKIASAAGLIGGFYVLFNYIVPPLLGADVMHRNRELPILMAIGAGLGSAIVTHNVGLSPALGAFIAGLILAESPFSTQIRADVASLRTLLMTLFFSSIGMLGDPMWIASHIIPVAVAVLAIFLGKSLVVAFVMRLFKQTPTNSLATGLCLAQAGEFSIVLATAAFHTAVIDEEVFRLAVSAMIATLFMTPPLVAAAPRLAEHVVLAIRRGPPDTTVIGESSDSGLSILRDHTIIIGFGPSGQGAGHALLHRANTVHVVDLGARSIEAARSFGFHTHVGDASHADVLEHISPQTAWLIVVAIPDPHAARRVVELARAMAPGVPIIARSRFHRHHRELDLAGASIVIDEEQLSGMQMAEAVRELLPPEHSI